MKMFVSPCFQLYLAPGSVAAVLSALPDLSPFPLNTLPSAHNVLTGLTELFPPFRPLPGSPPARSQPPDLHRSRGAVKHEKEGPPGPAVRLLMPGVSLTQGPDGDVHHRGRVPGSRMDES